MPVQLAVLLLFFAGIPVASGGMTEGVSQIELAPAPVCWPHDAFLRVQAKLPDPSEARTAKLYFRCVLYPDFYFVELVAEREGWSSLLPKPESDCPGVEFYVEEVTTGFLSERSPIREATVEAVDECRRGNSPLQNYGGDDDPKIPVGRSRSELPSHPPGFQVDGIQTYAGGGPASSGGSGKGLLIGVGIGGAAAGTVLLASGDGDSSGGIEGTTSSVSATTSTTSVPPTSTSPSPNQPPRACIETDPRPPVINEGGSIRFDASCSKADGSTDGTDRITNYAWNLGDGRTRDGRVVTPTFGSAGRYTVSLTVTDSFSAQDATSVEIEVREVIPVTACFTASDIDGPFSGCEMRFDASCSSGRVQQYQWILDVNNAFGAGPVAKSGRTVTHPFACGADTTFQVQLTVVGENGNSDTLVQSVTARFLRAQRTMTSFTSFLTLPGSVNGEGRIQLNGMRMDRTIASVPFRHGLEARSGENVLEATLPASSGPGTWRFDFSGDANFERGSIQVDSGAIVSRDASSVAVNLSGEAGERVRIRYRLRDR